MNIQRLINQVLSSFLLLNFVRRYKSKASLMKIKAARAYVLGVKKARLFFLAILSIVIAFVFLFNGLSLVQAAFFTYSKWSNETKFIVALALGLIELLGAMGVFIYLFREETWGKFTGVHHAVNLSLNEGGKNE